MTEIVTTEYTGAERRAYSKTLAEVEEAFDRKMRDHEVREQERIQSVIDALKHEAFPDGAANHCAAHQAMIDAAKQEADFWRTLKIEIAKKSIWGILQILVFLVLAGAAAKLGFGALMAGVPK